MYVKSLKKLYLILSVLTACVFMALSPIKLYAFTVSRNTKFTTAQQMSSYMALAGGGDYSPLYLTEAETVYWDFATSQAQAGSTAISIEVAKNCYRNLEMLLDNGYTMDYNSLYAYCQEYLGKKNGQPDSFYSILTSCLDNPYMLNRPKAKVTATTYNGRDYSKVFDASYYMAAYPDAAAQAGADPAELLRHFVEVGVGEGRRGNAAFDVASYAAQYDASVLASRLTSSQRALMPAAAPQPVAKYSYSWANYYGRYLGHYDALGSSTASVTEVTSSDTDFDPSQITDIDTQGPDGGQDNAPEAAKVVTGVYTETSGRSVYTNEPVSQAQANIRPIAVMMPTDSTAQPSYGISRADILYEIMEEGEISRQMAVISNWQGMDRIGNLRSCRLYYIPYAKEWDPILIHFGGVAYMKGVINGSDMNNLSGTYEYGVGGKAPGASEFYRTSDRKAPHNAYISSSGITKACQRLGYQTALRSSYYNARHFNFADGVNDLSSYADSKSATSIDLSKVFPYSKSSFKYNSADGLYYKSLFGKPQKDGINSKQIAFANVIVQHTKWKKLDKKGYLGFTTADTTEDGYYFTKGRCIHVTWAKTGDYVPTKYYDDNGNEIRMNTGKTYIAVAQKGREVIFS